MRYLTRICFNSEGWTRPTGEAAIWEKNSFCSANGYGHEEWLFRSDWQLDGWQYGFLQGVGKSSSRAAGAKNLDITLYTVHPGGERRFVARLPKTEALDAAHAQTALSNFSNSGLLKICDKEIRDVGGKPFPTVSALQVVNVRFRAEDIEWFMPDSFASASDPLRRWNRYQLYHVGGMSLPRASRGGLPKGGSYWREGSGRCFIPADHSKIQRKLYRALVKKHGAAQVFAERNFVDLEVVTGNERVLYEIKSDFVPRTVIRLAVGQLLEYAYRDPCPNQMPLRLVAVGRRRASIQDTEYLEFLQKKFNLPIEYLAVPIDN